MSAEELFDSLWVKLPEEAYEEPQVGWVPEDTTYRFEWEKEPGPKQIEHMKKGKPVVVKAKWLHDKA